MRKSVCFLLALLLCGLLLTGCGSTKEPSAPTPTAAEAAPVPVTVAPTEAPEPTKVLEPTKVPEPTVEPEPEEKKIVFGLDEAVLQEGFCELSGLYAEVLDDAAKAEGWYYYYTDTDESPARTLNWEPAEGNYTTAEVLFTAKNLSNEPQTFGNLLTAQMLYRENRDAEIQCFEGTVFQQNPGQVEENGDIVMWSTKPTPIAAGESTMVSFRFDIPKSVYEKMAAAAKGEETGIEETCVFSFDGITVFEVDLVKSLVLASQYE